MFLKTCFYIQNLYNKLFDKINSFLLFNYKNKLKNDFLIRDTGFL